MTRRLVWLFLVLILVFLANMALPFLIDDFYLRLVKDVGIVVILALSLNLVLGHCGQFSLGHAGFMAVGAYTSAAITTVLPGLMGISFDLAWQQQLIFIASLLCGGFMAAWFGFMVGLPTLRLRGDYLAIATLGFSEIVRVVILSIDSVGAARGLYGIPNAASFLSIFMTLAFTVFILQALLSSRYGRYFHAIREDEVAALAVGIRVPSYKVMAFVISSFFAGIAGALFAHHQCYINPSSFQFQKSIEIVVIVVVGGLGNNLGVIISAVCLSLLPELLRELQKYTGGHDLRMIIYSFLLIVIMLVRPKGLFASFKWPLRSSSLK